MSSLSTIDTGFICKVCETHQFASHFYSLEFKVCGECARRLGAAWIKAHSGSSHPHLDPEGYAAEAKQPKPYKKKPIPQSLRWQVFERDEFRCVKCGTHRDLRADHIVPESKGGVASMANLQTLCEPCNRSKGASHA